jgi:hypothetical protein
LAPVEEAFQTAHAVLAKAQNGLPAIKSVVQNAKKAADKAAQQKVDEANRAVQMAQTDLTAAHAALEKA